MPRASPPRSSRPHPPSHETQPGRIRHACELLDAWDGSIGLYDERREVFRTEAIYRMPLAELGREMHSGVGLAGLVLLRRAAVVLERYDQVPLPVLPILPELAGNAVLGMPIFWRDRLIGFFGIGAPPPRRFDEKDVEILGLLGRHAAVAIENARLYERVRQSAVLEERNRLARELHDSVTQKMFSLALIAQTLGPAWKRDPAEGERRAGRPRSGAHLVRRRAPRPPRDRRRRPRLPAQGRPQGGAAGRARSNKEIAKALHLSEGTVKGHVSAVLSKLGVEDRTQAALFAVREGLVPLREE